MLYPGQRGPDFFVLFEIFVVLLYNTLLYICDMNATSIRKQTSFRLSEDLIASLRVEAQKHNRSLNNLVESILLAFIAERPNPTTLKAMQDAETGRGLETLDLKDFKNFVRSL